MKNAFSKITYFLLFIFFFTGFVQAQKKDHFILVSNGTNPDLKIYEDAVRNYSDLDKYRFYDKRRRVIIQNSGLTLELFSALELKEKFNKPVSPLTIMPGSEYQGVEFYLSEGEKRSLVPLLQKNQIFKY